MKFKKDHRIFSKSMSSGYSLIELVFYIALFAVLSFVVIDSLLTITKAFNETSIQLELRQASEAMDRISREIRQAGSINTLNVDDLTLNTKDDMGLDKTIRFLLSGQNMQLFENGALVGNLNSSDLRVTGLSFTQISTTHGEAVRVVLTAQVAEDALDRTIEFSNTVVLRGGY